MKARTHTGDVLNAEFSVDASGSVKAIILESSGGQTATSPRRNPDYNRLLELLLRRLAEHGFGIRDILLDTQRTQRLVLSTEERRLRLRGWKYPIDLRSVSALDELRRQIGSAQVGIAQKPGSQGGNSTKRIRLELLDPPAPVPGPLSVLLAEPGPEPNPPTSERAGSTALPPWVETTTYRVVRDTPLAKEIKTLHSCCCQILGCEYVLETPGGGRYAEAHHIQPLGAGHDGLDVAGNILCVCPNHHAELDLLARPLSLADLRVVEGHHIDPRVIEYHNREYRKKRESVAGGTRGTGR